MTMQTNTVLSGFDLKSKIVFLVVFVLILLLIIWTVNKMKRMQQHQNQIAEALNHSQIQKDELDHAIQYYVYSHPTIQQMNHNFSIYRNAFNTEMTGDTLNYHPKENKPKEIYVDSAVIQTVENDHVENQTVENQTIGNDHVENQTIGNDCEENDHVENDHVENDKGGICVDSIFNLVKQVALAGEDSQTHIVLISESFHESSLDGVMHNEIHLNDQNDFSTSENESHVKFEDVTSEEHKNDQ